MVVREQVKINSLAHRCPRKQDDCGSQSSLYRVILGESFEINGVLHGTKEMRLFRVLHGGKLNSLRGFTPSQSFACNT